MKKTTVADRIIHHMKTHQAEAFMPMSVAYALQENPNTIRGRLSEMVASGELVRQNGLYRIAGVPEPSAVREFEGIFDSEALDA